MSRLRAVEHGRSVVHVSTVGVSALITPDGTAHQRSALFTSALLAGDAAAADGRHGGRPRRRLAGVPRLRRRAAAAPAARGIPGAAGRVEGSRPRARRTADDPPRAAVRRRRAQPRPGRPGGRAHPDLQRAREPAADRRPGARRRTARPTSWCSTTAPRTAPARSPTSWPPTTTQVHVLHRHGKEGLGAAYLAGFGWALDRGYDVAGRDGRRRLAPARAAAPRCWPPSRTPTWCSAPAGCPAARWSTGRCTARCSRAAATSTPGCCWACRSATPPAATGVYRAAALKELDLDDVASQGYCFQVDLAWRAVRRGLTGRSRCRSPSSSARSATPR